MKIPVSKINAYIVIIMVFLFPLIALMNYFFDFRSGILSYGYRTCNLALSLCIIFYSFSYKKIYVNITLIPLIFFWFFYLLRITIDLEYFQINQSTTYSKSYYYLYAIFINFTPMVAMSLLRPVDFGFLALRLRQFLQFFSFSLLCIIIYKFYNDPMTILKGRFWLVRNGMEFLNPITIAIFSAILIILLVYKKKRTFIDLFFIVLNTFIIIISASRGPLLFLLMVLFLIVIFKANIIYKTWPDFLLKSLFFIASIIIVAYYSTDFLQRITSGDDSSSIRYGILSDAVNQFFENPFTGSHFLILKSHSYTHNLFFDVLLSTGILGFLLITPSLLLFFQRILNDRFKTEIFIISFFFFLTVQTSGSVYASNEFWCLFSLIIAGRTGMQEYSIKQPDPLLKNG